MNGGHLVYRVFLIKFFFECYFLVGLLCEEGNCTNIIVKTPNTSFLYKLATKNKYLANNP